MKTLATLLALALAAPAYAQDTELRRMPLNERTVTLSGPDYRGEVGRRDYDRDTIDDPRRGAGFGQNPYRGFLHSEDFGRVTIKLMSYHTREGRWVDTAGGAYVELIDIGDQGSDARITLTALDRNGRRYVVPHGVVRIEGGGQRLNRNLLRVRYEGFLRSARLEIVTGPGRACERGEVDRGAPGCGDGFLFAVWGRADCLPTETNRMVVTRRVR